MRQKIKDLILDILFPRFCLSCNKEGTYLCEDCKTILEISEHRYCLCDINTSRLPIKNKIGKCKRCKSKKLSGLYFALSYKEKTLARKLIHFFKDPPYYVKDLAGSLASLIIDHIYLLNEDPRLFFKESLLIPIPLAKEEMKKRDYNQAEELAKEISKITDVPVLNNVLIKKASIQINDADAVSNKKIFLIDDVYTPESIMEECATQLLESGAKEVWGIVVARG